MRLGHPICNRCVATENYGNLISTNTNEPLRMWTRGFWYDMGQVHLPLSASHASYPRLALQDTGYRSLDFGPREDGQFRVALENVPLGVFNINLTIRTIARSRHDGKRRKVAVSLWKTIGRIKFMIGAVEDPGLISTRATVIQHANGDPIAIPIKSAQARTPRLSSFRVIG